MRNTLRLVLLVTIICLAPCAYTSSKQALAQKPDSNSKLGSIKGRVLSEGQAVTNASVTVSSVKAPEQARAVPTNDNGDFEVKGLESGLYRVQVSAPAYASVPNDPEHQIYRVGDSITLNMVRGGVITGRVVTGNNDPVVAVRVRALMIRDSSGRPARSPEPVEKLTDDRGIYRIFGLVPGTYVVFAGGRGFYGTGANAYDNDAPTFAPSSTRDTAQEILLVAGDERTIDIRYRGNSGHSISGNATAPTRPDSPWISIKLARLASTMDFSVSTYQNGTKGFEFQGAADGDYLIWADYTLPAGEALSSEPKRITVKGADVTGVELAVKPLASVAGVVILEPSTIVECKDKRRPVFEETFVTLRRNQRKPAKEETAKDQTLETSVYSSSQAVPDRGGSFKLSPLAAGQYNFDMRLFAKYWYLRSVTLPASKDATSDLARNLLTLKSGDRITGLKAILTEGAASINGAVDLPEDRPSGRIVFYAVPAEKDKAEEVLRYFAAPVADDGSFTMEQVPPGRYWTLAKLVADNDSNAASLRLPAMANARAALRREAETAKAEIELKPCQSVKDYKISLNYK